MSLLATFNRALRMLGESSPLADESEIQEREAGRILQAIWDDGCLKGCLEEGQFNFAIRTSRLDYNPDIDTSTMGGLKYGFNVPDDWVRWADVCEDNYFQTAVIDYMQENGMLFSDLQTIYVRYVSNGDAYGADFSLWPQSFQRFVSASLAEDAALAMGKSEEVRNQREKECREAKFAALNKDALQEPVRKRRRTTVTMRRMNSLSSRDRC